MNNDQALAFGRTALTFVGTSVGTYLVSHGYLNADQLKTAAGAFTALAGAIVTIAPLAVSLYNTWKANSAKGKLASVAAIPEVAKVTMVPTPAGQALADASPAKVTT